MGDVLRTRLLQSRFDNPHHEALLSLLVAASQIYQRFDEVCGKHRVTRGQYNVLRILRGVHPEGYARCEIARRMVDRAPDVTRLIDRLAREKLVERIASDGDRRLSLTRITSRGLDLLDRMRDDVAAIDRELAQRLSAQEANLLSRLAERVFADDSDPVAPVAAEAEAAPRGDR